MRYSESYGVTSFFESGDSFILSGWDGHDLNRADDWNYPKALLEAKPPNFNVSLRIYQNPEEIEEEQIDTLKRLGVREIFLGLEHIDGEMRRRMGKPPVADKILRLIKTMEEHEIEVVLALMFGLPGETKSTAAANRNFAEKVVQSYSNVKILFVSIATPLVGTALFKMLARNSKAVSDYNAAGHCLESDDEFDYKLLCELFIRENCEIEYGELMKEMSLTRAALPGIGSCSFFSGG